VWWRLLLAYLGTAAVVATVIEILAMPGQAQYQALVSRGVHTSGQVVPDNGLRGGLGYAFAVQGNRYTRSGSFAYLANQQLGDTVPVVYEASNPANNCSCDPAQVLSQEQWSPILLAAWMSLIVPLGYSLLMRMRRGQVSSAGRWQIRVGPPSRFIWWAVSAVVLSIVSVIAGHLVQPVIYFFVVIALGLIWFPLGVLLDRLLTQRLRQAWTQPRP
jgi:hypothetical protein